MSQFYRVSKKANGNVEVMSAHQAAQQAFFGWGSDQNAIDGSFYGKMVEGSRGRHGPYWRWNLTPAGAERMVGLIRAHIDDPSYYSGAEKKAAQELLTKLTKPTPRRPSRRRSVRG